jgi:hypothetical protein
MQLLLSIFPTSWLIKISNRENLPESFQILIAHVLVSRFPIGEKDYEFEEIVEKVLGN